MLRKCRIFNTFRALKANMKSVYEIAFAFGNGDASSDEDTLTCPLIHALILIERRPSPRNYKILEFQITRTFQS